MIDGCCSIPHSLVARKMSHIPSAIERKVDAEKAAHSAKSEPAIEFARQAEKLAQYTRKQENNETGSTQAVEAKFVTPQDPVVETANGGRLPAIPVDEANKLNKLRDELDGRNTALRPISGTKASEDGPSRGARPSDVSSSHQSEKPGASLRESVPASRTNPLFPPLPMYGPPTVMRTLHCWFFMATSAVLSLGFLLVIILGAAFTSIPLMFEHIRLRLLLRNPDKRRPFFEEEVKRRKARKDAEKAWIREKRSDGRGTQTPSGESAAKQSEQEEFVPTEGGPDPLVCDVAYYARRVGLEAEVFDVQTEDGFIIELWHLYNPREYRRKASSAHGQQTPNIFEKAKPSDEASSHLPDGQRKYPVLLIHGLLQSAGAFCCNDDDSLAFFLAKSGYDVWLGNNRCGFLPKHTMLQYSDPRMWAWNIRQMGVLDLPALISRVLAETGFPKLGLVAHSQGTTQTFVALAKEQRPDIGEKISVFCALAPAAYAGGLVGKMYFKFMRVISPGMFRCIFGIHAFIPFMMEMHKILPGNFYGAMGYRVFAFLFNWTDTRWERDLRDRMFQFAPVYVSSESMRWWLGRECFARQKCILATKEEGSLEDEEDEEEDSVIRAYYSEGAQHATEKPTQIDRQHSTETVPQLRRPKLELTESRLHLKTPPNRHEGERGQYAWYNAKAPPMALWVAGNDDLVDGRRLLRRFDRGREPHVRVVHKKIIEGYEHLDVIWAMDALEKVGKEVREVVWRTAPAESRAMCRVPKGCERVFGRDGVERAGQPGTMSGGPGRLRLGSVSAGVGIGRGEEADPKSPTVIDSSGGQWQEELERDVRVLEREGREGKVHEGAVAVGEPEEGMEEVERGDGQVAETVVERSEGGNAEGMAGNDDVREAPQE